MDTADIARGETHGTPHPDAPEGTKVSVSDGLANWLRRHRLSLAFSSYQSSQLFLAGVTPGGQVSFSFQAFGRAMGIVRKGQSLYLGAIFQLWRIENLLRPGEISSRTYDAVYLPRLGWTIGDLDVHEIGITGEGKPLFINTRYNCLCTVDPVHAFRPIWKPSFISEIAQGDRCHLNGLAMDKGRARYVTALRQSDVPDGWRDGPDRGLLIDVERNRIVHDRLFMPHSPRFFEGSFYLLESGRGYLVRLDPRTGEKVDVAFCPGFLRGLAFHEGHAIVTLSKPRKNDFDGVPLDREIAARGLDSWCGVAIIDLASGEIVEWIRMEGMILQLFDVTTLPGVACPMLLGPQSAEMANAITFDLSALPGASRQKPARR